MARTRRDLVIKALDELGVTQVGQDPSAEDYQLVDKEIAGKLDDLTARRVVRIDPASIADPTVANIRDGYFLSLAKLIANAAAPDFGIPYDGAVDAREEERLRVIQADFTRRIAAPKDQAEADRQAARDGPSFAGIAQRDLAGAPTFAGIAQRPVVAPSTFTGSVPREADRSGSFAGQGKTGAGSPQTFAGQGKTEAGEPRSFAGQGKSTAAVPQTFAGTTQRPVVAASTFRGDKPNARPFKP